jgi:hypothetical protein
MNRSALLVIPLLAAGCALPAREIRFTVEPSGLDYAVFVLQPAAADATCTRIELSGTGHVQQARGRSKRVVDSFWQQRDTDTHWDDLATDQVVIPQEQATACLQALVNAGWMDRARPARASTAGADRLLMVYGRIAGDKAFRVTADPAFKAVFDRLHALFSANDE